MIAIVVAVRFFGVTSAGTAFGASVRSRADSEFGTVVLRSFGTGFVLRQSLRELDHVHQRSGSDDHGGCSFLGLLRDFTQFFEICGFEKNEN